MPPAPGQEEPMKRMVKIVNALLASPDVEPFREPVDWRGLELYDYPKVITKMMDLGTIKRRLERGQYSTAHQVAEDIRLVWNNCMTYNADGSDFWLLAKSFLRRFEDRYRKVRNEFDVGEDLEDDEDADDPRDGKSPASSTSGPSKSTPSSHAGAGASGGGGAALSKKESFAASSSSTTVAPASTSASLDVRAKFGANLFLLSGVELGWVMTELELKCPHVLESWGQGKIEINVDEIPQDIFARLEKYVHGLVKETIVPSEELMEPEVPKKKKRKST
mmetsp:Transcript_111996/g.321843  ORF Transcript_111996/g.321843 Transcript_111996/m.321843 type:complete len:277 (-) Transcript_111996:116-946(-)